MTSCSYFLDITFSYLFKDVSDRVSKDFLELEFAFICLSKSMGLKIWKLW